MKENTALTGIRMLDLGRYQAGPRCALMFARMGAEVIKVEALTGDESRRNGPMVRGQSAYWVQYNSGKKSLAVDLRKDAGKQILRDLVKVSDLFVQNFRPGTIEKMGFGYDVLKKLNRRVVMINVSAYGQDGPYRDRIGFDPIGQALSGLMMMTGEVGGPPVRTYFPLIDRITSLHATTGALAALLERERSGQGQAIDVSLADTGFTTNEIPIAAYLGDGIEEPREGNGAGLSNAYRTSDGWVYIAGNSDNIWPRICDALEHPEWLDDYRYKTKTDRLNNNQELEKELSSWFSEQTTNHAVDRLSSYSIPAAPINNVAQAASEKHLHDREILMEVPDPVAGQIHVAGKMIKFSRTPMVVEQTPVVGEHTKEILSDILDYNQDKIQELSDLGVVNMAGT